MEQLIVVSGRTLLKIAKIKSSMGLKGDMKIIPFFFTISELGELFSVCSDGFFLFSEGSFPKKISIKESKQKNLGLTVSFVDVNSRTEADKLKDLYVCVDYGIYKDFLKRTKNIFRLVGYTVIDKGLGEIGQVNSILRGKQDLLALDDKEEKLIPFVNDLIESVDDDNNVIRTILPEGIF
jgi:16S rRNA processing protein RimM